MKTKIVLLLCFFVVAAAHAQDYSWDHLPVIQPPVFKKDTFTITAYGAIPDGLTLNTNAINTAIADCSRKGGGVVLVPAGYWLTGPIVLKSGVNLHVVRAAMLQFSSDLNQYPIVAGNWEGHPAARCQSPLSGTDLENIAITGSGIIDGNGDAWRWIAKDRLTEAEWKKKIASGGVLTEDGKTWFPSGKSLKGYRTKEAGVLKPGMTLAAFEDIRDFLRPNLLVLTNCKKVLLDGPSFQNSPAWCLHTLLCENLTVHDVHVRNPWYAANGDGIDVESCRNVLLENSTFDAGDDGICIKSGRDEEGRKRGRPTENVIVRDNIVYRAHGGFVIGSEMSGGARNIFVYNCSFQGTDIGLRFKTTRGRGGVVEKIYIKNISMKDIEQQAVFLDMYYFARPVPLSDTYGKTATEIPAVTEATPQFRDIHISHIVCDGAKEGIFIRGLPEMSIRDIYLEDMVLKAAKGAEITAAQHISLKNIRLVTAADGPMQLAARTTTDGSVQPVAQVTQAGGAGTSATSGNAPSTAIDPAAVIYIENSSDLLFNAIQYDPGAATVFSVNGDKCSGIRVEHTDVTRAARPVTYNYGAKETALEIATPGGKAR